MKKMKLIPGVYIHKTNVFHYSGQIYLTCLSELMLEDIWLWHSWKQGIV